MSERGYTLVEMLVAMTMFALVTVATSYALTVGLRAHGNTQRRAQELDERTALLRVLTRDLSAASVTTGNQYSQFVAGGSDNGTLLTFTSLAHRMDLPAQDGLDATTDTGTTISAPQSDLVTVVYTFDADSHTLSRSELMTFSLDQTPQQDPARTMLSNHVRSISFQYVDSSGQQRSDWSYYDQQQQSSDAVTQNVDTELPAAVQVTIEMDTQEGAPERIVATIALVTPQPLPAGQKPATTSTASAGGTRQASRAVGGGIRTVVPSYRPLTKGGALPGLPGLPGVVR